MEGVARLAEEPGTTSLHPPVLCIRTIRSPSPPWSEGCCLTCGGTRHHPPPFTLFWGIFSFGLFSFSIFFTNGRLFLGYLGHRSGPRPNHRCHGGIAARPMKWHLYLVSAVSMDDVASMCPGRGEPPLNVGRSRLTCTARLVSNMPYSGPSSVACMAGVVN